MGMKIDSEAAGVKSAVGLSLPPRPVAAGMHLPEQLAADPLSWAVSCGISAAKVSCFRFVRVDRCDLTPIVRLAAEARRSEDCFRRLELAVINLLARFATEECIEDGPKRRGETC